MERSVPDYSGLRPAGRERSSKRDRILNIFLRQEGHLSADDLFDLVRAVEPGIGRATVYRTLQWMVDADVARKVDFGEGRSRYEPSYRHPRHFHLICAECHQSSEFLSSDVEALMEEIASARGFTAAQSVVRLRTCEDCRTGRKTPPVDGATTGLVFARDALRMAMPTERSGFEFYTRAATLTKDHRGRAVFQELATEEQHHLGILQKRYRELTEKDPQLESRPTFLFFKGAANGLFDAGIARLSRGVDNRAALSSASSASAAPTVLQRYGDRFEDSEGEPVFSSLPTKSAAIWSCSCGSIARSRQRQGRRRHAGRSASAVKAAR